MAALGFVLAYEWDDEVTYVDGEPTAFVLQHPDGREVDVHVVGEGRVLWRSPWQLPPEQHVADLALLLTRQ